MFLIDILILKNMPITCCSCILQFRDENELKCNKSCAEKLSLPEIIETVNMNYLKVEPFSTLVDDALERIGSNQGAKIDPYGQEENDEVADEVFELNNDLRLRDQCIDDFT